MLISRITRLSSDSSKKFETFRRTNQLILQIKTSISQFNQLDTKKVWEKMDAANNLSKILEKAFLKLKALHPISSSSNFMLRKTQYVEHEKITSFCVESLVESFSIETNAFYRNISEMTTLIIGVDKNEYLQDPDAYCKALGLVLRIMRRCAFMETLGYNDLATELFLKIYQKLEEVDEALTPLAMKDPELANKIAGLHGTASGLAILYLEFALKHKNLHLKKLLQIVKKVFVKTITNINVHEDVKILRMINGLSYVSSLVYPLYQKSIEEALHFNIDPEEPDSEILNHQIEIATTVQSKLDTNYEHLIQKRYLLEFQHKMKILFKKRLNELNIRYCLPFFKNIFLRGFEVPMPFSLELLNYIEPMANSLLKNTSLLDIEHYVNWMTYVVALKGLVSKREFDVISKLIYKYQVSESDLFSERIATTDEILFNNYLIVVFFMTQPLEFIKGRNLEPFEYALYKTSSSYSFLARKFSRLLIKIISCGIKYSDYLQQKIIGDKLTLAMKNFSRILVDKYHDQTVDYNNKILGMCYETSIELNPVLEFGILQRLSHYTLSEIYVIDTAIAIFQLFKYRSQHLNPGSEFASVVQEILDIWKPIKFYQFFIIGEGQFHAMVDFKIQNICEYFKAYNYFYIEQPAENIVELYDSFVHRLARFILQWNVFLTNRRNNIRDFEEVLKSSFKIYRLHKICIATIEFFSLHSNQMIFIENEDTIMQNFDFVLSMALEELNYDNLFELYAHLTSNPMVSLEIKARVNQTFVKVLQYFTEHLKSMAAKIANEDIKRLLTFAIKTMGFAYDIPFIQPSVVEFVKTVLEFKLSTLDLQDLIDICYLNILADVASPESILPFVLEIIRKYPAYNLKFNSKIDWQLEMTEYNVKMLEALTLLQAHPIYSTYKPEYQQAIDLIKKKLTEEYILHKDYVIVDSRKKEFIQYSELAFLLNNKLSQSKAKYVTGIKLFSSVYDFYIPEWNTLIMIEQNTENSKGSNYFATQQKIAAANKKKIVVLSEEAFLKLSDVQAKIAEFDQIYQDLQKPNNN